MSKNQNRGSAKNKIVITTKKPLPFKLFTLQTRSFNWWRLLQRVLKEMIVFCYRLESSTLLLSTLSESVENKSTAQAQEGDLSICYKTCLNASPVTFSSFYLQEWIIKVR